jgi:hypothetical protein
MRTKGARVRKRSRRDDESAKVRKKKVAKETPPNQCHYGGE